MSQRVFISHTGGGADFARALREWLGDRGIDAWLAAEVEPGDLIEERIEAELSRASAAVIVLTDTLPSPWTRFEWSSLLERSALAGEMPLVPVQLGSRPPPPFLASTQVVDLSGGPAEWQHGMVQIGNALEKAPSPRVEDTSALRRALRRDLEISAEREGGEEALRQELAAAERALDRGRSTGDGGELADLLRRVGVIRLHLGDAEGAVEPLAMGRRILAESGEASATDRVSTSYCLANALSATGKSEEAARLLSDAAVESARTDVDELTTAAISFRAGQAVEGIGRREAAHQLFSYAHALTEPILGPENPTVESYRRAANERA